VAQVYKAPVQPNLPEIVLFTVLWKFVWVFAGLARAAFGVVAKVI